VNIACCWECEVPGPKADLGSNFYDYVAVSQNIIQQLHEKDQSTRATNTCDQTTSDLKNQGGRRYSNRVQINHLRRRVQRRVLVLTDHVLIPPALVFETLFVARQKVTVLDFGSRQVSRVSITHRKASSLIRRRAAFGAVATAIKSSRRYCVHSLKAMNGGSDGIGC
jgi:hypothetical protein